MSSIVYRKITVGYDSSEGSITCDPMVASLYHDTTDQPNAAQWVVEGAPPKATRMLITWDTGCPFASFGIEKATGFGGFLANGLRREKGVFKYTILFTDDEGRIVGGIDPVIVDSPRP